MKFHEISTKKNFVGFNDFYLDVWIRDRIWKVLWRNWTYQKAQLHWIGMQFEHMHHIHFLYSLPTGSEVSISIDMEAEQDFMNRVSKYDFEIFNPCRKILGNSFEYFSKISVSRSSDQSSRLMEDFFRNRSKSQSEELKFWKNIWLSCPGFANYD